jgi:hypothetical protein
MNKMSLKHKILGVALVVLAIVFTGCEEQKEFNNQSQTAEETLALTASLADQFFQKNGTYPELKDLVQSSEEFKQAFIDAPGTLSVKTKGNAFTVYLDADNGLSTEDSSYDQTQPPIYSLTLVSSATGKPQFIANCSGGDDACQKAFEEDWDKNTELAADALAATQQPRLASTNNNPQPKPSKPENPQADAPKPEEKPGTLETPPLTAPVNPSQENPRAGVDNGTDNPEPTPAESETANNEDEKSSPVGIILLICAIIVVGIGVLTLFGYLIVRFIKNKAKEKLGDDGISTLRALKDDPELLDKIKKASSTESLKDELQILVDGDNVHTKQHQKLEKQAARAGAWSNPPKIAKAGDMTVSSAEPASNSQQDFKVSGQPGAVPNSPAPVSGHPGAVPSIEETFEPDKRSSENTLTSVSKYEKLQQLADAHKQRGSFHRESEQETSDPENDFDLSEYSQEESAQENTIDALYSFQEDDDEIDLNETFD